MAIPKYLEAFRRAVQEARTREKSEVSEKSPPNSCSTQPERQPEGYLNSLNTLISPPSASDRSPFGRSVHALEARRPDHVDVARWQQCVEDGRRFLSTWGEQAEALGWTSMDMFGLHTPPATPHPSYSRLSRYDCTGLCWLLQGRRVVALTERSAAIENPISGSITVFRK
jgi:hypothetical protein